MNKSKEDQKGIMDLADAIQQNAHVTVEYILQNPEQYGKSKITYQDAMNTWLFTQLAKLEYRIKQLEDK
jgi:hypothetical protein